MAENEKTTEAAPAAEGGKKGAVKKKKKIKKSVSNAVVHIHASFNNTVVTIADEAGNTICWSSAGARGFKGARKSTPFAAQIAAEDAARKAYDSGVRTVRVLVGGPGAGRETALRALSSVGLNVTKIQDVTPLPHNGCRPPKKRRV